MALPKISYECRVAKDPELSFTKQGTPVLKLRTVASKAVKSGSGQWQTTGECWLDVVLWHEAEAIHSLVSKGTLIHVVGDLQTREWQAKDGTKRSTVEVKASLVALVGKSDKVAPLTAEAADPWADVPATVPDWSAGDAPF